MRKGLSVLVCGFGCHLNEGFIKYLDRLVVYCNELKPEFVVFSGGETQQCTAPGRTEAQVMHDYVVPRCPELTETTWLKETNAFTSLENVWYSRDMLQARTEPGRLVTYTDAGRTLKVRLCTYRHMPGWDVIQEVYDMRSNPLGQVVSLVIEGVMVFVPPLHKPWSWYRRNIRAKRI